MKKKIKKKDGEFERKQPEGFFSIEKNKIGDGEQYEKKGKRMNEKKKTERRR